MALGRGEYLIEIRQVGGEKIEVTMNGVASSLKQVNKEMKDIAKSSSGVNKGFGQTNSNAGLAGATLTEFSRTVSDMPYGINAVTNNLSQLSTLFITLQSKTKETAFGLGKFGGTIKGLLKELRGPLGIVLTFQAVLTALDFMSMRSKKAKRETEDLTDSMSEQIIVLKNLNEALKDNNITRKEASDIARGVLKQDKELKEIIKDQSLSEEERNEKIVELAKRKREELETEKELSDIRAKITKNDIAQEEKFNEIQAKKEELTKVGINNNVLMSSSLLERTLKQDELNVLATEFNSLQDEQIKNLKELAAAHKELNLVGPASTAKQAQEELDAEKIIQENLLNLLAARKRVLEDFAEAARMQEELDGLSFIEEGGVEDFEFALNEFDEFLSKFVTKKEKYDEIAEQAALDRADELAFELDGFVNIEQEKERIREFFASKREQAGRRETNQLIREINARTKIQMAYVNTLSSFAGLLDQLGEHSKAAMVASIIAEKAAGIGSIIINTAAANAKAVALFPVLKGEPFVTLNRVSAALGIAASILAARNAIKGIKSGQASSPSSPSGGGAAPAIQAPDFNVVGATAQSQLAETIAGAEARPTRAYVVGKDITTQQELDRNITNTASFG
mgnify:CR=1 FL=1|tara:strand:- start:64 stop:1938 length:1875 start_codon:yes stop_codon:yes gene_type:complete